MQNTFCNIYKTIATVEVEQLNSLSSAGVLVSL